MDGFEKTLENTNVKLDKIFTTLQGKTGFEPLRVLQFITFAVVICGAIGTTITYMASNASAGRIAVIEFQTNEMWKSGHYSPNITTITKTTGR